MRIGLIVFSRTGNTLSVVKLIEEELKKRELNVKLEEIKIKEDKKNDPNFIIINSPNIENYDYILFGCAVEAFSLSMIGKKYFKNLINLDNKRISFITTQNLKQRWLGGNNAVRWIIKKVKEKNGILKQSAIINWSSKDRQNMIEEAKAKIIKDIIDEKTNF